MDRLAKTLASYGLWALILLTSPLFFVVALVMWLVTVPFDRRLRWLHLYSCAWASFYTYLFPYWTTLVRNRERLRNDTAYVVVSNHQSLLDILVLFRLYRHFKWVSKEGSSASPSSAGTCRSTATSAFGAATSRMRCA